MKQHILKPVQDHKSFETDGALITVFLLEVKTERFQHPLLGTIILPIPKQDYVMTRLN